MRLSNVPRRLTQIYKWGALSYGVTDYPQLVALGIARHHPFTNQDVLGRLGHKMYPELSFRLAQLDGKRVVLDPADRDQMIIFEEIAVEPRAYDFKIPFTPDMIFDCGGHIGLFCVSAAAAFPGVHITSFEPNPKNVRFLRRNVEINQINATVVQAAVSITDGQAWFESGRSPEGHLAANPPENASSDAEHSGFYRVEVVNFPRLLSEAAPQRPLLKIDIEGEELRVIPALIDLLPPTSAVYFETHNGDKSWNTISALFVAHGFAVEKRRQWQHCCDGLACRVAND